MPIITGKNVPLHQRRRHAGTTGYRNYPCRPNGDRMRTLLMQGLHSAMPRCTPAYVLAAPDGAYTDVILYLFIYGGFAVLD